MKNTAAGWSLLLFGVSIILWLMLTVFESALAGASLNVQRLITFLLLVLPSGIGAVLGAISLFRREGRMWPAIMGIILNTVFALYHVLIILFAG